MRIIKNQLIIRTDAVLNETISTKNKVKLYAALQYEPERHTRCYGEVMSVPFYCDRIPVINDVLGGPAYYDMPQYQFKSMADIPLEVEVGDKVYFHYNVLLPDDNSKGLWNTNWIKSKLETDADGNKKRFYYFKANMTQIIAVVRDGKVIPIGSHVLVEPDLETWEEILLPIAEALMVDGKPVPVRNADGTVKMKPKSEWIQKKVEPEEKYLRGWVRHIGTPLNGDKCSLKAGDYVYFQKHANTKIEVEGKVYYRMLQRRIFGIDKSNTHL
jgi:hypothetical protein